MDLFGVEDPLCGIRGRAVPALFPQAGPLHSLIFGEAPGPRGADKSGIPFWGDAAGLPLYRALERAGCAIVPVSAWRPWDGLRLLNEKMLPQLHGVALSNAFPSCPTNDGRRFRAPARAELQSSKNSERLEEEVERALKRGAHRIVTLGRCARDTLVPFASKHGLALHPLPHPSAQGLLSDAPNRGKGLRLQDLAAAWEERLAQLLENSA
jgi:uracil-DNA glycosylase